MVRPERNRFGAWRRVYLCLLLILYGLLVFLTFWIATNCRNVVAGLNSPDPMRRHCVDRCERPQSRRDEPLRGHASDRQPPVRRISIASTRPFRISSTPALKPFSHLRSPNALTSSPLARPTPIAHSLDPSAVVLKRPCLRNACRHRESSKEIPHGTGRPCSKRRSLPPPPPGRKEPLLL